MAHGGDAAQVPDDGASIKNPERAARTPRKEIPILPLRRQRRPLSCNPTMENVSMKHTNTLLTSVVAAMLGLGLMGAGQAAHAKDVKPPPVPANLEVPAGNTAFLVGHAIGHQNYQRPPPGTGLAPVPPTPEATLIAQHHR